MKPRTKRAIWALISVITIVIVLAKLIGWKAAILLYVAYRVLEEIFYKPKIEKNPKP